MSARYDVIIAGLGAMGSQALAECGRRRLRAIGFDRFSPPHDQGSSHGKSRIIREAYAEGPDYVPLVRRAYERWAMLEEETGTTLYRRTGGLWYGPPAGEIVAGARRSADLHGLPFETLGADDVRRRFPVFTMEDDWVALLEPRAGILAPEAAIAAALTVAERGGATIRRNEPVLRWRQSGESVEVETAQGKYAASRLIISAGMWLDALAPELKLPLTVQRNALYWFTPASDSALFEPGRFPVFLGQLGEDTRWYGFPDTGDGVKIALHHHGASVAPDAVDRVVKPAEVEFLRSLIARFMPAANGVLRATAVCTYTNVPDEHFIIDRHPLADRVLVASPCSGHGFKFASAIGEALVDLAETGRSRFDLAPFSISRAALRS